MAAIKDGCQLANHPLVQSNLDLLENWIDSQMAYKAIPGMSVAVVHDQACLTARGFGCADVDTGRPTTPDTVYRMASHTKLFTAIAIMQLRDAGKLGLDDTVRSHLPWFKLAGSRQMAPLVNIRHLLTHSSGLPREAGSTCWSDNALPKREEIVAHLQAQSPVFPPATRAKYSNLAFFLLGEIVSALTGQEIEAYIADKILRPLGMSSSALTLSSADTKPVAKGYGRHLPDSSREVMPSVDIGGNAAAGGLSASLADMVRFMRWQFRLLSGEDDPVGVLQATTLREMQRNHRLDTQWQEGWGLAFRLIKTPHRILVGHDGGLPGFKTATYISPEERLGVCVLSNAQDSETHPGEPQSVLDRAFEWVGGAILEVQKHPALTVDVENYDYLTGTYRAFLGDCRVMWLDGDLVALDITHPHPKTTATVLTPTASRTEFYVNEGHAMGPVGEMVTFTLGGNGDATEMMFNHTAFERID